ncbi:MAG: hypothetical protein ACO1TE_21985 [Prosthecobacter sp.]
MKHFSLLLLAALLCSCGSAISTSNPAQSYAGTELYREKDGSLQIVGDWDYVALSTVTDPPSAAAGGIKASLARGKVTYAHYTIDASFKPKAGAMHASKEDVTGGVEERPYTRAMLDQAAQGAGLTVAVPRHRTSQFFSAAYLQGFLRKVDETVRNPAVPVQPTTEPWHRLR